MIKVIVCDMDGTLLNSKQTVSKVNVAAIKEAKLKGVRFIIATGRKYKDALFALEEKDLFTDFVAISGAEVRDQEGKLVRHTPMSYEEVEFIANAVEQYDTAVSFHSVVNDYMIGSKEAVQEGLLEQARLFFSISDEDIKEDGLFQEIVEDTIPIEDVEYLKEHDVKIYKVFIFSKDQEALDAIEERVDKRGNLACASSFKCNVEITHEKAQKGPIVKEYIENLGYHMDEVMVIGDSMNDYSMLSMDFGATVAMDNAMEPIKEVAKYITKTNEEDGVAHAIYHAINGTLERIKNK